MPFAIISAMERRYSSVMPGSAAGGARRIAVAGWPAAPTVIQRILPCPSSFLTSKPRYPDRRLWTRRGRRGGGRLREW